MEIESISHKGLRLYFETGKAKGLVGDVARVRRMLAFMVAAPDMKALATPPNFGLHPLTGNRVGIWSMTVTKNWRMTFRLDDNGGIIDLDLEDYHGS